MGSQVSASVGGAKSEFTFLGIGKVNSFQDNFTEVYDKDGTQTFCLEFELSCADDVRNPAFLSNFDRSYEEERHPPSRGRRNMFGTKLESGMTQ